MSFRVLSRRCIIRNSFAVTFNLFGTTQVTVVESRVAICGDIELYSRIGIGIHGRLHKIPKRKAIALLVAAFRVHLVDNLQHSRLIFSSQH